MKKGRSTHLNTASRNGIASRRKIPTNLLVLELVLGLESRRKIPTNLQPPHEERKLGA